MRNIYFVVNSYHKYCTCKETIINTLYCFRKKSVKIAYIIASYLCQNQQFHQCQRFSGAKSDLVLQSWFRSNSNSSTAVTLALIHNHFKWVIIVIIALVWASTEIPDFRKQLRIVFSVTSSQAVLSIIMASRIDVRGSCLSLSTALIILRITRDRYLAFNDLQDE